LKRKKNHKRMCRLKKEKKKVGRMGAVRNDVRPRRGRGKSESPLALGLVGQL